MNRNDALSCVGMGWGSFINNLYDAKPKKTEVIQVKEKYGQLNFNCGNTPDWYLDLIACYEEKSLHICENCGAEGKQVAVRGWIQTCCETCLADRLRNL